MKNTFYALIIVCFLTSSCSKQTFEIKHEIVKVKNLNFELKNQEVSKVELRYIDVVDFSKGTPSSILIQKPCIRVYLTSKAHQNFKKFLISTWFKDGSKSYNGVSFYVNNVKVITNTAYSSLGKDNYIDFTFHDKDKNYIDNLKRKFWDSRVTLKIKSLGRKK